MADRTVYLGPKGTVAVLLACLAPFTILYATRHVSDGKNGGYRDGASLVCGEFDYVAMDAYPSTWVVVEQRTDPKTPAAIATELEGAYQAHLDGNQAAFDEHVAAGKKLCGPLKI